MATPSPSNNPERKPIPDETPHKSAQTAPSLTDAEANRQVGQGQAPRPPESVPEANQGPELGDAHPNQAAAQSDSQTVKVGARDVVRLGQQHDDTEGGEESLTDPLAKKDAIPSGPGGAKSAIG